MLLNSINFIIFFFLTNINLHTSITYRRCVDRDRCRLLFFVCFLYRRWSSSTLDESLSLSLLLLLRLLDLRLRDLDLDDFFLCFDDFLPDFLWRRSRCDDDSSLSESRSFGDLFLCRLSSRRRDVCRSSCLSSRLV